MILHPVELGALTQLYGGTAPEAAEHNGRVSDHIVRVRSHGSISWIIKLQYLRPWARLGEAHKGTNDVQAQEEMWTYCEREVKAWL